MRSLLSRPLSRLMEGENLAVWFVQLRVQSGIYLRVLKNHQAFRSTALYLRAFQQHLQIHNLGVGTEELFDDHSCIMVIASMTEFVDDGICAHPLTHRVLQLRDHQFCLRWGLAPVGINFCDVVLDATVLVCFAFLILPHFLLRRLRSVVLR